MSGMAGRLGSLVLLSACAGGADTGGGGDTDVGNHGPPTFEDFVNVTEEALGDFTCYTAGDEWLIQDVDPAKQQTFTATITVNDFQEKVAVSDVSTKLWYSDDVGTTFDVTGVTDDNGQVDLEVVTCSPTAYLTYTDPQLSQTKNTFKAHQVFEADDDGAVAAEFFSVSEFTYEFILNLLGITLQSGAGVLAGKVTDCADVPIEKAQIIVRDADGSIPENLVVNYFVDDFPTRDQPYTSPDGLWLAANVPVGTWTVELWTRRDGALVMSGATEVVLSAEGSIQISNIFTGFGGGVRYPASCLGDTDTDTPA